MAEARPRNLTPESSKTQGGADADSPRPGWQWPKRPEEGTGSLLTLTEIQERFGVSEYWIYKWAGEGKLHVVQVGKRFKYPDWEVQAAVKTQYPLSVAA